MFISVLFIYSSFAKELVLGVGLALPPYFIKDENRGLELDIIKESLKVKGHTLKTVYVPFKRVPKMIEDKKVDCVGTVNESTGIKAFFSNSHIFYHNKVITLKRNNISVKSLKDLEYGSIVAFQNATKYLGSNYASAVSKNPAYREKANQERQVTMLVNNRIDKVVSDVNIFNFYAKKQKVDLSKIDYQDIFNKVHQKVAFIDKKIKDDFNYGLSVIKKNGTYDKILKRY
jgi:polar amino acid transport system substrate-binding protein